MLDKTAIYLKGRGKTRKGEGHLGPLECYFLSQVLNVQLCSPCESYQAICLMCVYYIVTKSSHLKF